MSRQWHAAGVVEAPVHAVFAALLTVGPGAREHDKADALTDSNGVLRYAASTGDPAHPVTIEVDQGRQTLAVQGQWWYRGVYAVREHPRGSLVEYRVHNVATRARWAVPLMQRRLPHHMRRDLAALLQTIGQHLGCPAYASPEATRLNRQPRQ